MPRGARKQSKTEAYHVMLRGNGQKQVFEDAEDSQRFIELIRGCNETHLIGKSAD